MAKTLQLRLVLGTVVACLLAPTSAKANDTHYHNYPVGARAAGLGGAFAALSNDPSGIYYNPAGLVNATRGSLSVSANLYGIEIEIGDNIFESVGSSLRDIERVFTQLNIIPSSAGFISSFGEHDEQDRARHAYGIGAFVPSYRSTQIQTSGSLAGGEQVAYQNTLLDFTFHTAAAYSMRVDDRWNFGASAIFNYRQVREQEETQIFGGPLSTDDRIPFNTAQTSLGASIGSVLFTIGLQAKIDDEWTIGGALTTPSVDVYETADLRVIRSGVDARTGRSTFQLDEPTNIDANNPIAGSLRLGFARVIKKTATFTGDLVLHAPVRYKLIDLREARDDVKNAVTIGTDIERNLVANVNLGFEALVARRISISFGFFTNFTSAPRIPGEIGQIFQEDRLPHFNAIGGSTVLGWFSEHTLTRLGVTGTIGQGSDVIPQNQALRPLGAGNEFKKIRLRSMFVYLFLASTFRY